jgi:hypothetical protein
MRTPLLAALTLLALAPAAPASAEPLRLDEGRLAGVAAGQVGVTAPGPGFNISSLNSSSTTTSTSNTVDTNIGQTPPGVADNSNTALGLNSTGVNAQGTASATVMGTISGLGAR